jgi:hypothetical protein
VSFFPNEIELPANGKAVVDYTIRVPEGVPLDGGYVAVLFFEGSLGAVTPAAASEKPAATVQFAARLGSLIFVDVKGTVRREGRLSSVSVSPPREGGAPRLRALLGNEGNTPLTCEGSFNVMGPGNLVIGRGELPARYVWPGDQVAVETAWQGSSAPGTLVMTYDCGEELILVEEAQVAGP